MPREGRATSGRVRLNTDAACLCMPVAKLLELSLMQPYFMTSSRFFMRFLALLLNIANYSQHSCTELDTQLMCYHRKGAFATWTRVAHACAHAFCFSCICSQWDNSCCVSSLVRAPGVCSCDSHAYMLLIPGGDQGLLPSVTSCTDPLHYSPSAASWQDVVDASTTSISY